MPTKTYAEMRQAAYFKAARELRKVAALVLDDIQNETELRSIRTLEWAKMFAARVARQAQAQEDLGHEQCVASAHAEAANRRSHEAYSNAVTAFQWRVLETGGATVLAAVNAYKTPA